MRSLNSICRARDEARYVSRTWSNSPSAPDVPWEPVYKLPVKTPDDIIGVCVLNPKTLSGIGLEYMPRHEYEAKREKYQADMRQWEEEQKAKRKNK
jgi:hypothetical protein